MTKMALCLKKKFFALVTCILLTLPGGFANTSSQSASDISSMNLMTPSPSASDMSSMNPLSLSPSASGMSSMNPMKPSPSASGMSSMTHMMPSQSASDMSSMMHMKPPPIASDVLSSIQMMPSHTASDMTSVVHTMPSPSVSDISSMMHMMPSPSASDMSSMVQTMPSTPASDMSSMMRVMPSPSASDISSMMHMMPSPSASDMSSMVHMMPSPSASDMSSMMHMMPSPSTSEMALTVTSIIPTVAPTCPSGFTGNDCSKDIDDCEYENCSGNGDCLDRINGFICECKNNYFGKNCEKKLSACNPNPCENDGTCREVGETFKCTCTSAFEGATCQSGSVGVDYELLFPTTSNVTSGNIVQALREGNGSSELGFLRLTGDITVSKQFVQTTAAPTATKEKSTIKDWEIVLIAAATIVFFLLVAIGVLAVKYRNAVQDEKKELYALDGDWQLMENGYNGLRAQPQSYASPTYDKVPGSDNKAYQHDSAL